MKYAIAAAVLVTIVSAQSLSDIPQCALPCIDDARTSSTNCATDDYACICSNKDVLTAAATGCILQACGADVAAGQVLPAVNSFCDAVESGSNGSSTSSGATVSSTVTATPTDVSSTTASQTVTNTSITSLISATSTSTLTSNSTTTSSLSLSSASNTPTSPPTAGAASAVGSLAMLAFCFAIAL
ncbi:hypothetical protein F4820DRAFT_472054 [Hypoxylon rubiginosum]|uniref:Uncharacterized protein n=1 Tax=Hypoxylon rubiginosum TaxID=110542 RepID=A0ACB9YUJ2_9PEZI|nr:hypothetical protein F4820DRAFT_472054 [Hypoxylon rubiginosum]